MSLDVYLTEPEGKRERGSGIFVRRDGSTVEVSREEWDRENPDGEPVTFTGEDETSTVYDANITHNLNRMAAEAGIYEALWRPETIGITKAEDLIVPLIEGLARLTADPERFKALNPENGWGTYDGLVDFVRRYVNACKDHRNATVSVSR